MKPDVRVLQAADFYVSATGNDRNDGSFSRPWATIQHAALVVAPGATVHVAAGTYAGPIRTTVSGTATTRIRFVSDTPWSARIVSTGGAEAVWRNDGDYATIEGFDVSGDGAVGIQNLASQESTSEIIQRTIRTPSETSSTISGM
jgi:muconolactone delta-isomerase